MKVNPTFSEKNLTIANFAIVAYFIGIWLIYTYQIDYKIIGVIGELLTIPFLVAQVVLIFLSIWYAMKNKTNLLFKISTIALVICSTIIFGTFF